MLPRQPGLVRPVGFFYPAMTYTPKTEPFPHQKEVIERTRDVPGFALFHEMGLGKSKIAIDSVGHLFMEGKLNGLMVLAPKAVAPNWVNDELPTHLGVPYQVFLWDTGKAGTKRYQDALANFLMAPSDQLAVLVMSYDAIMTERTKGAARGLLKGKEAAKQFLEGRTCMFCLDESARIKSPSAKRTKRVLAAAAYAPYRRVMTGTPVTNSPFDVYSQLKFIDPNVWSSMGCGTFESFKTMFGVWIEHERKDNGQRFKQLVDYQNLPTLNKIVDRLGSRLLKDDVLDLPPKVYEKRVFEMSPPQRKLYDQIKKDFLVWLESGDMITAPLAITRLLRLQQVAAGYCPTDDGNMVTIEPNPRLSCLMDTLEDVPGQAIIWAKFQKSIDMIEAALRAKGETCVVYDGRVSQGDRETRRREFKDGKARFFIANPSAAGEGLTLTEAKTVVYYESTYKLADRLQSEDRAHRIGQTSSVLYLDIVAQGTIDTVILRALRTKNDLAAQVTGDKLREWI